MVLDGKYFQEFPVNAGVLLDSSLGSAHFLLYSNELPDDVICSNVIYVDDTTLYCKCDQVSDMSQQLQLAPELESDLQETVDWGRKWLVDLDARKTQLVSFNQSNNTAIDVKMDGFVIEEK